MSFPTDLEIAQSAELRPLAEIADTMVLPYFAAAWLTRCFLPEMHKRGTGHIVNIGSVASRPA